MSDEMEIDFDLSTYNSLTKKGKEVYNYWTSFDSGLIRKNDNKRTIKKKIKKHLHVFENTRHGTLVWRPFNER